MTALRPLDVLAPATPKLAMPDGNVGPFIRDLAARHRVTYVETPSDRQADDFARMSDCEVKLDAAELLLMALVRAGVLTRNQHADLHDAYIRNDLGLD